MDLSWSILGCPPCVLATEPLTSAQAPFQVLKELEMSVDTVAGKRNVWVRTLLE